MELKEKEMNNCTIISITGMLISQSEINRLEKRIFSAIRKRPKIILNMSGLELIGTQGIRMLIEVWKEIFSMEGFLILAGLQSAARITFTINKATVFIETGTVAEALEKIKC